MNTVLASLVLGLAVYGTAAPIPMSDSAYLRRGLRIRCGRNGEPCCDIWNLDEADLEYLIDQFEVWGDPLGLEEPRYC